MIPSGHGHAAADLVPGCRFELIPGAGHYPHEDNPDLFAGSSPTSCHYTAADVTRLDASPDNSSSRPS